MLSAPRYVSPAFIHAELTTIGPRSQFLEAYPNLQTSGPPPVARTHTLPQILVCNTVEVFRTLAIIYLRTSTAVIMGRNK